MNDAASPIMSPGSASNDPLGLEGGLVLVPTDFSSCAEHAYAYALEVAAEYGASVRLLHVLTAYDPALYEAVEESPYATVLHERVEEAVRQQLQTWAARTDASGPTVEPVVRRRLSAAQAVLEEAEACNPDLVVVGTHGRGRLGDFFLGSVARQVLQGVAAPVAVVRERSAGPAPSETARRPSARAKRLLVPTDFSEAADVALRAACALARRYEAELDLLHVVKPIPFPASVSLGAKSFYDYLPDLQAAIEQELDGALEAAACRAEHAVRHVEEGTPDAVIVERAASFGAGLVVMATHGRGGLERFVLGSVTERVVRRAPCPVLVVRP